MACEECAHLRAQVETLEQALELREAPQPNMELRLFEFWLEQTGRNPKTTKFKQDRRRKVRARVREGYTEEELQRAIVGNVKGGGAVSDQGVPYNDLTTIFQSSSKVELNISRYEHMRRGSRGLERKLVGL